MIKEEFFEALDPYDLKIRRKFEDDLRPKNHFQERTAVQKMGDFSVGKAFGKLQSNNFTLGETQRDLTNVSPLAAYKFYNQTSKDILNKYFPDSNEIPKGNTSIIEDITVKSGYNFETYNYYFDSNHNGIYGDGKDTLAFKLLLFISPDGNKVKECYEVVKPADDEVILFLESDKDVLSEDKLYGRMSDKVHNQFTDKDGNLKSNLFDDEIMKAVKKYADINQEVVEELMKKGFIENKIIDEGFFIFMKYAMMGGAIPAKALGWILNKLGNGIDFLKIPDEFWDTENSAYYFKKEKLIENLSISTEKLKMLDQLFQDRKGLDLSDLTPDFAEKAIKKQITVMKSFVENYNSYVKTKVEDIFKTLENPVMQDETESVAEKVALICGIWNGLVDFVSSIFKFLGTLLEAPFDISKDFQHTLEMADNFADIIFTKDLFQNVSDAIGKVYEKIKTELKSKNSDDFNWVRVAYFTGFGLSTIVSFFIPIADLANVAKAGKLGEIIAKFTQEISNGFVKGANILTQKTEQAFQNSVKIIQEILELFAKGGKKLEELFEKVWKQIVEWFLKNRTKEIIDEIYEFIKLLKKNFNYVECIRLVNKNKVFALWMSVVYEAMIKFYTGNVYQILNKALREIEGVKMTKELEAMQKVLDKALEKLPPSIYNEGILQRSLSLTEQQIKSLFKVGEDFTEKGFMSTTYSEAVLLDWMAVNPADNVINKVMGKNGKLIEDASLLPNECEVLFKSNTAFVVESVKPITHPIDRSKEVFEIILKEK